MLALSIWGVAAVHDRQLVLPGSWPWSTPSSDTNAVSTDLSVEPGKLRDMPFTFVDLFAGIGGFHAALGALGGRCAFASEIDPLATKVYERNWQTSVAGDIVNLTEGRMAVPPHDVLAAGFPCQPFSKSGFQRGMAETRGTLFWNICRVLEERRPSVIVLENVRNLAGPRHRSTWSTIVRSLRDLGYRVSGSPTVFSPHLLPPELGGRPQVRDRVFITGTYVGRDRAWAEATDERLVDNKPVADWNPLDWSVAKHLPLEPDDAIDRLERYKLSASEARWVSVWDDFVSSLTDRLDGARLPGFPIWADAFVAEPIITRTTPRWKAEFLHKNSEFYREHREVIDQWKARHADLVDLPPSRRKFEWQAQDTSSLWETVLHFRPSGIRAKRATYLPALVAITQTSIIAERRRRITPREAARLQGLPDWFAFGDQPDAATYRQLGNGVNVGAAYFVLRQHVLSDQEDIGRVAPALVSSVMEAEASPDRVLSSCQTPAGRPQPPRAVVEVSGNPARTRGGPMGAVGRALPAQ
jgi:DNA (cytosine-5)-methyltransferase 1